jgi:hypothetical protein
MKLTSFNERPWLLLCEGEGDKRLLEQLISIRGIPDEFQIRFPDRAGEKTGGRSKFGSWLALQWAGAEAFRKNVKGILIMSDNDDSPEKSFEELQQALRASDGFPIPATELTPARNSGRPPLVIIMVPPGGKPGSLETLCLEAAFSKWPSIKAPVDTFASATPIKGWNQGKTAKAKLQAVIASTCEGRPEAGFVGHWMERADYHLPVSHTAFDDLDKFLRGFEALITT